MEQVTAPEKLIGKTIKSIVNRGFEYDQELIITFEDDTFAIIQSEMDYESAYHNNFRLKDHTTDDDKERLGIITNEELYSRIEAENLKTAKYQLQTLKERFPQLFV